MFYCKWRGWPDYIAVEYIVQEELGSGNKTGAAEVARNSADCKSTEWRSDIVIDGVRSVDCS
jgi:hypothetical protein